MIARTFSRISWALVLAGALFGAARMAIAGAPLLGAATAFAALFAAWVYNAPRAHAARYLLPGRAAFATFVLLPLLYTVYVAFTNFSGEHLLSQDRVRAWFAQDFYAPDDARYGVRLYPVPGEASSFCVVATVPQDSTTSWTDSPCSRSSMSVRAMRFSATTTTGFARERR